MTDTATIRIIGIDPGSRLMGYGIIDSVTGTVVHVDNGNIRPKTTLPHAQRLQHIYMELQQHIAAFRPHTMAIEEVFVGKNVKSALLLGQARGIALLCAAQAGLDIFEISTRSAKQAVTGYGNATKEQMQFMTMKQLGLPEVAAEDAADALAIAMTCAQQLRIPTALREYRTTTRVRR